MVPPTDAEMDYVRVQRAAAVSFNPPHSGYSLASLGQRPPVIGFHP